MSVSARDFDGRGARSASLALMLLSSLESTASYCANIAGRGSEVRSLGCVVAWPSRVPLADDQRGQLAAAGAAALEVVERRALDADLGGEPHRVEQRGAAGCRSGSAAAA